MSIRKAALYGRVSTSEQNIQSQVEELREFVIRRGFEVYDEYADQGFSGAKDNRPALDRLMRDARQRRFDIVVVTAFDRFGRSLRFLVNVLAEFNSLGIDFVSVRQAIDTTTPTGKMTFAVISAMAEFERALISERVRQGMKRASARGQRIGRPPVDESLVREVMDLRQSGYSYGRIARKTGRSRGSIVGIIRRLLQKGHAKNRLEGPKIEGLPDSD